MLGLLLAALALRRSPTPPTTKRVAVHPADVSGSERMRWILDGGTDDCDGVHSATVVRRLVLTEDDVTRPINNGGSPTSSKSSKRERQRRAHAVAAATRVPGSRAAVLGAPAFGAQSTVAGDGWSPPLGGRGAVGDGAGVGGAGGSSGDDSGGGGLGVGGGVDTVRIVAVSDTHGFQGSLSSSTGGIDGAITYITSIHAHSSLRPPSGIKYSKGKTPASFLLLT